jgi:aryl-alcohol dehydrogenase-like predicted oxidoreductase
MEQRKLGKEGLQVSALGLGCMGMSMAYGPADEKESLQVLHRYLELGGTFSTPRKSMARTRMRNYSAVS